MAALIRVLLRMRALVLILLACMLVAGTFGAMQLDVEAYPDPSPPLVEIITQNPAWSAEEMEQQVTAPVETGLYGIQHLNGIRSISIFGLSDVKLYFTFDSDYRKCLTACSYCSFPMDWCRSFRRGRQLVKSTATSSPAHTPRTT